MHPDAPPVVDMTKHLEVEALLERRPDLLAAIAKCIICERRSDMTGVFVLNSKHAPFYGAPAMKERKFVYGLCSPCSEHPDRAEILKRIGKMFFKNAGMPEAQARGAGSRAQHKEFAILAKHPEYYAEMRAVVGAVCATSKTVSGRRINSTSVG